jgi:hypothetical protein
LSNLEKFINDEDFYSADYLVKMALIHYQFESIHPFYDGNGRIARLISNLPCLKAGYPPIVIDPSNSMRLFTGTDKVWVTDNGGDMWDQKTKYSPSIDVNEKPYACPSEATAGLAMVNAPKPNIAAKRCFTIDPFHC